MTNSVALTVDVELFVHTPAYRNASGSLEEESVGLDGIEYLLNLFERYGVRSTFFVVSDIAESNPEVIEWITSRGHEIASHTHTHRLLSELDFDDWRYEIRRSKEVLESVVDVDISGFRAPAFDRPEGLFEALHQVGYGYDSSVVPARSIPGWYGGDYSINGPTPTSTLDVQFPEELIEVPVSVMPGLKLPISAAWIRLLGYRYLSKAIEWLHQCGRIPVIYVHPWEFVNLPDVEGVPRRVYWHTGTWFQRTIESLVARNYDFCQVGELANTVRNDDG